MQLATVLILLASVGLVIGQGYVPEPPDSVECIKFSSIDRPPWDAPQCYGNLLNPLCSASSNGLFYCHPCNPYRQTDWECVFSPLPSMHLFFSHFNGLFIFFPFSL